MFLTICFHISSPGRVVEPTLSPDVKFIRVGISLYNRRKLAVSFEEIAATSKTTLLISASLVRPNAISITE